MSESVERTAARTEEPLPTTGLPPAPASAHDSLEQPPLDDASSDRYASPGGTSPPADAPRPPAERLVSLDAYRGFVMLAMVSEGLALSEVAEHHPGSHLWQLIGYQFSHVAWTGCALWDLIQPSFMFIVGVAMPYSYAARKARGDRPHQIVLHVLWRALALTYLGVFLRSNHRPMTNFTFEDVTSQIGLGYAFVFMTLGRGWRFQALVCAAVLVGYWLLFALWPLPPPDFDPLRHNIPKDWGQFTGFAAHWNRHMNPAGYFDRWFLNLWPRPMYFNFNGGGYQTLSFIPSMGTILAGLMTGEFLRGPRPLMEKFRLLVMAGLACLAAGMFVDGTIWPGMDWRWSLCPIVKKIWTPSWVIFAAGWTLLILAAFLFVVDILRWRRWTFPFLVVGMNSVAMYVMSYLFKPWVETTLRTHFGQKFFAHGWMPLVLSSVATGILWLVCYGMYRKRIFIRI